MKQAKKQASTSKQKLNGFQGRHRQKIITFKHKYIANLYKTKLASNNLQTQIAFTIVMYYLLKYIYNSLSGQMSHS